jgi:hypothetical protein
MIHRKINGLQFDVLSPNEKLEGKTYGEWLAASWNWLLSDSIENQNGPAYFLKTSSNYVQNGPHFRIGKNKVKVFADQAIFVPVIIALADSMHFPHLSTPKLRRDDVNYDINKGDNPPKPYQATIDGKPIVDDLKRFRVESPEFRLRVSENSPIKDELEVPIKHHGAWHAVSAGYCIIIKSLPPRTEPYSIHIWSRGRDNYFTEAFYDIEVDKNEREQKEGPMIDLAAHESEHPKIYLLKKMQDRGEITEGDYKRWHDILKNEEALVNRMKRRAK